MKQSVILILDPRGNISLGGTDVINRHENYGKHLSSLSNKLKLVVFTTNNSEIRSHYSKFLEIYVLSKPTVNSILFAFRSYRLILNENMNVKLLITGDPWESFWTALILNLFLRKDIPIQVQIHGDIANPLWKKINLQNRVRYMLAKLFCNKANAVRAVGKSQKKNLVKNFGIEQSKIKVIPVPISKESLDLRKRNYLNRPLNIAIIGRIHKDRGISYFLKLLEKLKYVHHEFEVIIIGGGNREKKFIDSVNKILGQNKVTFIRKVPEKKLSKYWEKIGVLVSLAPVESYGRVMREALVSGVPVWALESSGSRDLLLLEKSGQIRLLNINDSAVSLHNEFSSLLRTKPNSNFRDKFLKDNKVLSNQLIKSWIQLIKN